MEGSETPQVDWPSDVELDGGTDADSPPWEIVLNPANLLDVVGDRADPVGSALSLTGLMLSRWGGWFSLSESPSPLSLGSSQFSSVASKSSFSGLRLSSATLSSSEEDGLDELELLRQRQFRSSGVSQDWMWLEGWLATWSGNLEGIRERTERMIIH
jgi:hypothetical protein